MLTQLIEANQIEEKNVAAAYFTMTPDLNAGFPAAAARQLGWNNTALMCASEIAVPDSLPKCIRVLILFNTEKQQREIVNIYLHGTDVLRLQGVESS
jgi:chorismate mutase